MITKNIFVFINKVLPKLCAKNNKIHSGFRKDNISFSLNFGSRFLKTNYSTFLF